MQSRTVGGEWKDETLRYPDMLTVGTGNFLNILAQPSPASAQQYSHLPGQTEDIRTWWQRVEGRGEAGNKSLQH